MDRRQFVVGSTAAVTLAGSANSPRSNSNLRIIFPFAPGGSGDATVRMLADNLQSSLDQTVVVENRTGGAGRIGVSAVKNATPDGSTLLYTPFAAVTIYPLVPTVRSTMIHLPT